MKGKEEDSERMLTEKEPSQLSDTEFKAMVIRKLTELTKNYQKLQGNYNELTANNIKIKKEIETINKGQKEMYCQEEIQLYFLGKLYFLEIVFPGGNTISELKNTVEGIKRRLDEAEDHISKLEDKVEKNTQNEQEKEKRLRKNEERLREMQDNMKCNNIHTIGIPEGE